MSPDIKIQKQFEINSDDFLINSGPIFISLIKSLSEDQTLEDKSRASIKEEWLIIENWLGCRGRELTSADNDKISKAWKAYIATGASPSKKLQESFDILSKKYKDEGYSPVEDQAPDDVIGVFNRMLASDKEISNKKMPRRKILEKQKILTQILG